MRRSDVRERQEAGRVNPTSWFGYLYKKKLKSQWPRRQGATTAFARAFKLVGVLACGIYIYIYTAPEVNGDGPIQDDA